MPPAGFKRSRALWDDARRPRENRMDQWRSLLRAILYELQPIRFSQCNISVSTITSVFSKHFVPFLRRVISFLSMRLPRVVYSTIRQMTVRHWLFAGALVGYYFAVRWIHEVLHAGPMVLILTALAAIFTVGLGEKRDGELSAYSVFNRGFQRLLGEVDVDDLANQYVGGAVFGGGGGGPNNNMLPAGDPENNQRDRVGRNVAVIPPEPHGDDESGPEDTNRGDGDDNDSDDNNDAQRRGQSRKSGKKARRRNLEERREIRLQREAAHAMGFDGRGGDEEQMAMQQLIEDQVAHGNNNG